MGRGRPHELASARLRPEPPPGRARHGPRGGRPGGGGRQAPGRPGPPARLRACRRSSAREPRAGLRRARLGGGALSLPGVAAGGRRRRPGRGGRDRVRGGRAAARSPSNACSTPRRTTRRASSCSTCTHAGAGPEGPGTSEPSSAASSSRRPISTPTDRRPRSRTSTPTPAHRRRGLARAVVRAALRSALGAGHDLVFLVADEADWPKELYREIGFEPLGVTRAFHRAA